MFFQCGPWVRCRQCRSNPGLRIPRLWSDSQMTLLILAKAFRQNPHGAERDGSACSQEEKTIFAAGGSRTSTATSVFGGLAVCAVVPLALDGLRGDALSGAPAPVRLQQTSAASTVIPNQIRPGNESTRSGDDVFIPVQKDRGLQGRFSSPAPTSCTDRAGRINPMIRPGGIRAVISRSPDQMALHLTLRSLGLSAIVGQDFLERPKCGCAGKIIRPPVYGRKLNCGNAIAPMAAEIATPNPKKDCWSFHPQRAGSIFACRP